MASNRMTRVCRRHERSFLKALKEADSLKEKEVHRLRVDVKNLRVLLQLHHLLSDKKKPETKMQKLIQPLFDSAGEMRTAALNLKQTATYHNPIVNKFRQKMKAKEKSAAKKLLQHIKDFKPKKFTSLN